MKNVNEIYLQNCIDGMAEIEAGSARLLIADPPYNIGGAGGIKGFEEKNYERVDEAWDTFSDDDFEKFNEAWLEQMGRVLMPEGLAFLFGTPHNLPSMRRILDKMGWKIRNEITWFKPNAFPSPYAWQGYFSFSNEYILFVSRKDAPKPYWDKEAHKKYRNGDFYRDTWVLPFLGGKERESHPTQKPEGLIKPMILFATQEGDLVVDPFSGSGTVAVSCAKLHRRFIAFELEEKYWSISRKRLADEGHAITGDGKFSAADTQGKLF